VAALLAARREGVVVPAELQQAPLSIDAAAAIAHLLRRAIEADGPSVAGWKLGLTVEGGRQRLGSEGPFVAPVFSDRLLGSGSTVSLRLFAQPRIEAEFGVVVLDGAVHVVPCIEIADCHFEGWQLSLGRAIADFGLQGAVVVGTPIPLDDVEEEYTVVVRCDGREVLEGRAAIASAVERAVRLVPAGSADRVVATGRITALAALTEGTWEADFGGLGVVTVTATP
jgi:2-keto-4-pentenoate hydratase